MIDDPTKKTLGEVPQSLEAPANETASPAEKLWSRIVHLGLGETTLRVGTA